MTGINRTVKVPWLAPTIIGIAGGFGVMLVLNDFLSTTRSYATTTVSTPTVIYVGNNQYTEDDLKTKYHVRVLGHRPGLVTVHAKDDESIKNLTELGFKKS